MRSGGAEVEALVVIDDAAEVAGEGRVVLHERARRDGDVVEPAHRVAAAVREIGAERRRDAERPGVVGSVR